MIKFYIYLKRIESKNQKESDKKVINQFLTLIKKFIDNKSVQYLNQQQDIHSVITLFNVSETVEDEFIDFIRGNEILEIIDREIK